MTSPIDDLLSRARVEHRPCDQAEIDTAAVRIAARAADPSGGAGPGLPRASAQPAPAAAGATAARDLTVLCEAVVAHPGALTDLRTFFARVPGPGGGRVLGCMLALSGREDSARFLWQYAAGAGDAAAAYCLALHHRAYGETGEADWWQAQTESSLAPVGDGPDVEEIDPTTALRILRALKRGARSSCAMPGPTAAVLRYARGAVAFVDDDLDLPLPAADFADRVQALTRASRQPARRTDCRPEPLPERRADSCRPRIPAAT